MSDFDPALFLTAQDRVWSAVVSELTAGRKASHWMWFVFPQLTGLGRSPMAQLYGLEDPSAAQSYLADPVLGPRLVQVSKLILSHSGTPPERIMGPVDGMKLRSSMTLFAAVPNASPVFADILDAFYDGARCPLTLEALNRA